MNTRMTDLTSAVNGRPFAPVDLSRVAWTAEASSSAYPAVDRKISVAEPALFVPSAGPPAAGDDTRLGISGRPTQDQSGAKPAKGTRRRRRQEQPGPDSVSAKVERRRRQVAEAAQLRVHETDPDVVAWRVERTQRLVETILYVGIICGLAFTMVNVQQFAAGDEPASSLAWWAAWVLDPTVSAVLIAILLAGKTLARNGIRLGRWSRLAGVITVIATYTMNTWESWASGKASQIVLHSVPVVVVFVAVEVLSELRERFAEAVFAAHARAESRSANGFADRTVREPSANAIDPNQSANSYAEPTSGRTANPLTASHGKTVHERRSTSVSKPRKAKQTVNGSGRRRLADFVADARTAYTDGVTVTPEWVQDKARCSRTSAFAVIKELRNVLPASAFANDTAPSSNAQRFVNHSPNGEEEVRADGWTP